MRDHFKVLVVDLATSMGTVARVDGRNTVAGGSGLAALLFEKYGHMNRPWNDPDQPLIFAIGPLTGYFPLMSKTVCAFKSPYHDQYAESHGGGRSAFSLFFTGYDALVLKGKAPVPSVVAVSSRGLELKEVHYLWGKDLAATGKILRSMYKGAGHRTILRIGPAGEQESAMACITADTYRHFGRLGCGAVMGNKNLKGIMIHGDGSIELDGARDYNKLFQEVYKKMTATDMMTKYHNYGTPINVAVLNEVKMLPIRNLQRTTDPDMSGITGEKFAEVTLLRNMACSGCPVGCIHVGFVRERIHKENRYIYHQVNYDHEPIFAMGSMLSVTDCFQVLALIDTSEKMGLDVMSAGVALAWATEATEKGIISEKETIVRLSFGDSAAYRQGMDYLGHASNDFYRILGQGVLKAAEHYGGKDFACVLGQEMAGYATGEVFFTSQAFGLRHSHLDSSGYSFDQKEKAKDPVKAVDFLVKDEAGRAFLTSMVSCLFARQVYSEALQADCLRSVGYTTLADNVVPVSRNVQELRWKMRFATGYRPEDVEIPKRFYEVVTGKGPIDGAYLQALKDQYIRAIRKLGSAELAGDAAKAA